MSIQQNKGYMTLLFVPHAFTLISRIYLRATAREHKEMLNMTINVSAGKQKAYTLKQRSIILLKFFAAALLIERPV
jgi:hypothetical protein